VVTVLTKRRRQPAEVRGDPYQEDRFNKGGELPRENLSPPVEVAIDETESTPVPQRVALWLPPEIATLILRPNSRPPFLPSAAPSRSLVSR
jgi:hypothetical protein